MSVRTEWRLLHLTALSLLCISCSSIQTFLLACRFPVVFFALCIVLLCYIRPESCASFVMAWLGLLPNLVSREHEPPVEIATYCTVLANAQPRLLLAHS